MHAIAGDARMDFGLMLVLDRLDLNSWRRIAWTPGHRVAMTGGIRW
jgi:hypothetical protein